MTRGFSLVPVLFWAVAARAEVIGVFQTGSGLNGIVTARTRSGFENVQMLLDPQGKRRTLSSSSGWSLEGDEITAQSLAPKSLKGPRISVRTGDGIFHIPAFAGTYMLLAGQKAEIHFEDAKGQLHAIALPIRGGEIRAFRVLPEGLDLLVYDQQSISQIDKNGRQLFGVSPQGENVSIRVTSRGAGKAKKLGSVDPGVYWADKNGLFKVDETALKLTPQAAPR